MKALLTSTALLFAIPFAVLAQDVKIFHESNKMQTASFMLVGMESQKQAVKIDKQMAKVPGIISIKTTFSVMKSEVIYDSSQITKAELIQKISLHRVGVSDYSNYVTPNANRAVQYGDDGTIIVIEALPN